MDENKPFSLTREERDAIRVSKSVVNRINGIFKYLIDKLNLFKRNYDTTIKAVSSDVDSGRLIMEDISNDSNSIMLKNDLWTSGDINVYLHGRIYMFVCKTANDGPTTMRVVKNNKLEIPIDLVNKENTLLKKYDLRTNEVYLVRISQGENGFNRLHGRLYSLGDNNEELEDGDIDNLIQDLIDDNIDDRFILGMQEKDVEHKIEAALSSLAIQNNLKR